MSAAFTPGPWNIARDIHDGRQGIGSAAGVVVLAPYVHGQSGVIGEANARLIAAAPELYAACAAMIAWDDREKDHSVDFHARMALCEEAFAMARAALAKARGEP